MKHLKIHKFPFKNVIVLAIEWMYLKIQQKLRWLGCISKQTMGSAVKKTRLNSSKDDFLMKSFPFSTKRKLSILLNFLFRCIFNLEMQNSCLKTSAWWSRSSHFVENGYPSLRFPNMVKMNIPEHWTRVTRFNPLWVSGSTDVVKINTDIDLTSSTFSGISIGIKVFSTKA